MTYTLDEYKKRIAWVKGLVREELADVADGEVLTVLSRWRDDDDLICMGTWQEVFIDFNVMIKYIQSEAMIDDDGGELISKRLFWEVDKYKRIDGKMEKTYECVFGADGTLLAADEGRYFWLHGDYTERQKEISENIYLLNSPHNIILPYNTGDILLVDAPPFGKPFYVVYGGEMEKDEHKMSDYHYYHWCLYISEDWRGLTIDDLCNDCFSDYIHFRNSPLNLIRLAKNCNEPLIIKASVALKENPDLWFKWADIWEKHIADDGGLEQWIF